MFSIRNSKPKDQRLFFQVKKILRSIKTYCPKNTYKVKFNKTSVIEL